MEVISVTCPSCGAGLKLDTDRDKAFCSYCGSQVILTGGDTETRIAQIENYLTLADEAVFAHNGQEGYNYALKALELDASNKEAWFTKALATGVISLSGDMRFQEMLGYFNKYMELIPLEDKNKECINVIDGIYTIYVAYIDKITQEVNKEIRGNNIVNDRSYISCVLPGMVSIINNNYETIEPKFVLEKVINACDKTIDLLTNNQSSHDFNKAIKALSEFRESLIEASSACDAE